MEYTFIIAPLNYTVNNLDSIEVMNLVESTYLSLILESTQNKTDFRAVSIPCEHLDKQKSSAGGFFTNKVCNCIKTRNKFAGMMIPLCVSPHARAENTIWQLLGQAPAPSWPGLWWFLKNK